ncbi:MAG: hypothetical protein WC438_02645 [Candidatus Pacearchaeota archaeon]
MTRTRRVSIQKGGKGAFVRRKVGSEIKNICECWYNIDLSDGCIAQVDVDLLQEVIDNNGKYLEGNLRIYKQQDRHDKRCEYCYAYKNMGNVFPRIVNEETRKDFEIYKPKVLRLGKITETGHPYYYKTLIGLLELCEEFKTGVIFTTKTLPFGIEGAEETKKYSRENNDVIFRLAKKQGMISGRELANELKNLENSTLLYSLGYDEYEPGLVSQGFTNNWRIKQALDFLKEDVNVSLTVVCDVTQSIEGNVERGSVIESALEAKNKFGINIRLLPIRPNSEYICGAVTGESLKHVSDPTEFLPGFENSYFISDRLRYRSKGNKEKVSMFFHPDFQKLVDSGIGVCGAVGDTEYCDKCNLIGKQWEKFPRKELVQVVYDKKEKWGNRHQRNFPLFFQK